MKRFTRLFIAGGLALTGACGLLLGSFLVGSPWVTSLLLAGMTGGATFAGGSYGWHRGFNAPAHREPLPPFPIAITGDLYLVPLQCGHWVQTSRPVDPTWWCARHGKQPAALDLAACEPAVISTWDTHHAE